MAHVAILAFQEEGGSVPFFEWLESIPEKAQVKCRVRLERLQELGNELRRPEADYLRDGIYELRFKHLRVNHRVLYFFHGRSAVVLSHCLEKKRDVPAIEIELAVGRKARFLSNPRKHTAKDELP